MIVPEPARNLEYFDIGHSPVSGIVLWVHAGGRVRTISGDRCGNHTFWPDAGCPNYGCPDYDCSGRVDSSRMAGSIALPAGIGRKKARRVVGDVVDEFPGVVFRVFYDDSLSRGVSVQEFWEATE